MQTRHVMLVYPHGVPDGCSGSGPRRANCQFAFPVRGHA